MQRDRSTVHLAQQRLRSCQLQLLACLAAPLAALWGLIVWTVTLFRRVRPAADWLLAPYLLWVSFTAYLNAGIWLLN